MTKEKDIRTRNGKRIVNLQYVPLNSDGSLADYPVIGNVVIEEPCNLKYGCKWTEQGRESVFNETELDIATVNGHPFKTFFQGMDS